MPNNIEVEKGAAEQRTVNRKEEVALAGIKLTERRNLVSLA
jgi:hypothetical protein